MLVKTWNAATATYDVTFDLPSELDIDAVWLVGEFNAWAEGRDAMSRASDGRWEVTIPLAPASSYRFRYHLGGERWENDWSADDYVPNDFGGADSVVVVPAAPTDPPPAAKRAAKKAAVKKKAAAKKAAAEKKAGPTPT